MRMGSSGWTTNGISFSLVAVAEKLLGLKEKDIAGKYAPDTALTNDLMRTPLQEDTTRKDLKIYADNKESYFSKDVLDDQ